jgi:GrpB-like predicted nucleotidyltransferase (UPF0157 family)
MQHIGSTAVPGLNAKPVIDIMLGLKRGADLYNAQAVLSTLGYVCQGEKGIAGRLFFTQGDPCTHHLHLVEYGGEFWHEHILFRDELIRDHNAAEDYLNIKLTLAKLYPNNREQYTDGKAAVIERILATAKSRLRNHEN